MKRLVFFLSLVTLLAGCTKSTQVATDADTESTSENKDGTAPKDTFNNLPHVKDRLTVKSAAAAEAKHRLREAKCTYARISLSRVHEYQLELDKNSDEDSDHRLDAHGVIFVVDHKCAASIPKGLTIDFVGTRGQGQFRFTLPEPDQTPVDTSVSLVDARRDFKTRLVRHDSSAQSVPEPPGDLFRIASYPSQGLELSAYLSPDPKDGKKHPAIIWIIGEDCNSIDSGCWLADNPTNDQSASAYRKQGIVMMFPSLRGGNGKVGRKEGFFGEVDDVIAAADFLAKQPFVDADRIYLGGHATGGTLALLTAECSKAFRAVFSFGPVSQVQDYGPKYNPFVLADPKECQLREPTRWLHSIQVPVFVFEGVEGAESNLTGLQRLMATSKNSLVKFYAVKKTDHFAILGPANRLIAERILRDTGAKCELSFTEEELNKLFAK